MCKSMPSLPMRVSEKKRTYIKERKQQKRSKVNIILLLYTSIPWYNVIKESKFMHCKKRECDNSGVRLNIL